MTPTFRGTWVCAAALALAACGDDGGGTGGGSESGSGPQTSASASATATTTSTSAATSDATQTGEDGPGTAGEQTLPYDEDFAGRDGAPWPAPWAQVGTHVLTAELDGGRARLSGETGQVARMALPGFDALDVDVVVTVEFDDWFQQGFGFYVRQNGGALLETEPPGQGYAVYTEGGFMRTLGLWRELDGVETLIDAIVDPIPGGVAAATPHRVRFQCTQEGGMTRLRAKMWPADQAEPGTWMVETTDATPALQGTAGSFATDVYNYAGTGSIFVDDLAITSVR